MGPCCRLISDSLRRHRRMHRALIVVAFENECAFFGEQHDAINDCPGMGTVPDQVTQKRKALRPLGAGVGQASV